MTFPTLPPYTVPAHDRDILRCGVVLTSAHHVEAPRRRGIACFQCGSFINSTKGIWCSKECRRLGRAQGTKGPCRTCGEMFVPVATGRSCDVCVRLTPSGQRERKAALVAAKKGPTP